MAWLLRCCGCWAKLHPHSSVPGWSWNVYQSGASWIAELVGGIPSIHIELHWASWGVPRLLVDTVQMRLLVVRLKRYCETLLLNGERYGWVAGSAFLLSENKTTKVSLALYLVIMDVFKDEWFSWKRCIKNPIVVETDWGVDGCWWADDLGGGWTEVTLMRGEWGLNRGWWTVMSGNWTEVHSVRGEVWELCFNQE